MAWNKNLQECSFRGVVFDVLKTDDSADRAIAEHAYPYLDGADIEDLGRGARRVSIEAFFWDGVVAGDTPADSILNPVTKTVCVNFSRCSMRPDPAS